MSDEPDLKQRLAAARVHRDAGRAENAETDVRAILSDRPDAVDALNLLAVLLLERGEPDQASELLTDALASGLACPETLSTLSRARRLLGEHESAAELARRAIASRPGMAEAHLSLGQALFDLGDRAGAAAALRETFALASGSLAILSRLGNALIPLEDFEAIARVHGAILAFAPDRTDVMINLGTALARLDRLDEALAWHRKAASLAQNDPAAHAALALTLRMSMDVTGSIAACRRTLELAPDHADIRLLLANNLAATGDFAAAEIWCREALALRPGSAEARLLLAQIGRQGADDNELLKLRARVDDAATPRRERIAAGFAAGTLLDRNGSYDAAFAAFAIANRLSRARWIEAGKAFDGPGERRYVDWATSAYTPEMFTATASWGDPSEMPVFVVGMPRSGTSLVEQIAASHARVFGAGERSDIHDILQVSSGGEPRGAHANWDAGQVRTAAAAQVARLRDLSGGAVRVIDKTPDNCRLLGQIAVLFPGARIIVCRRDLRDVCVSCHFQQFARGLSWTTDLADLAERARQTDRLLAHWLTVLPIPVLEVQYENLVANLETESRRIIEFLGLEWDPACLTFHATERTVLTASVWQVRQPLYSGSVGRWRHYRAHLGPLLEGLKGLVPEGD